MNHLPFDRAADRTRRRRNAGGTPPLGGHARHLAASPDGEHVYATTHDAVKVIDSAQRVIASIPVGVDPKRTLVSPDGSRIYVTGHEGSVSIIDTVARTTRTVDVEASTAEVVSRDENYLYLAHNRERHCWVSVMSADGTVITAVHVQSYATALTLSPDGGRLYVTSSKPGSASEHGHGSISVIDTTTFTHIDVIPLQFAPDTIVVTPDGSRAYATHYNKCAISAIDLNSRFRTVIGLDDAPLDIAVSPDGDQLYVTNLHSLTLIDTATDVADTVPIGDLPRHLHVGGDGKRVYVTDLGHHVLWVLDPAERSILTTIDIGGPPEAVSMSPGEDFLFVADRSAPAVRVISLPSPKTA